jgi:hypothetical protein
MNMFVKSMVLLVTLLLAGCGLWLALIWLLPADDVAAPRPFLPFLVGCSLVMLLLFFWWRLITTLADKWPIAPAKERQWVELPVASAENSGSPVVRLAHFHYHLDDPRDPQSFAIFLDEPIFLLEVELELGCDDTPFQVIEDALVNYVRQVEHVHHHRLTVDLTLGRGSLTIGLTILAVYEFLAQYHDFIESVQLLQRQIAHLLREVTHWYRSLTGGELRIQSDMTIDSPTPDAQNAANSTPNYPPADGAGVQPITIINSPTPPPSPPGVQVIVYSASAGSPFWGCLAAGLVLMLVVLVALIWGCQVLYPPETCAWVWRDFLRWLY